MSSKISWDLTSHFEYSCPISENMFALLVVKETMKQNFVVDTVSADGQAPVGATASAGTRMIKFRSCI